MVPMFSPDDFQRIDESLDSLFYSWPRRVVHIDPQAIEAVGRVFRELIPPQAVVLDLMSSWRSHWPAGHPKSRMIGLGLNAEEMADNPDLEEFVIHDLNREPALPFDDGVFDAVVLTVSAQYLTRPIDTFQQVNRVLKSGGVFVVTFSNRMFPTKAVRIWRESTDQGRIDLVTSYMESAGMESAGMESAGMESAGNFEGIQSGFVNPDTSPPNDPIFAVAGRKGRKQRNDSYGISLP